MAEASAAAATFAAACSGAGEDEGEEWQGPDEQRLLGVADAVQAKTPRSRSAERRWSCAAVFVLSLLLCVVCALASVWVPLSSLVLTLLLPPPPLCAVSLRALHGELQQPTSSAVSGSASPPSLWLDATDSPLLALTSDLDEATLHLNLAVLLGHVSIPELYDGLPCIHPLPALGSASDCIAAPLSISRAADGAHLQLLLTTRLSQPTPGGEADGAEQRQPELHSIPLRLDETQLALLTPTSHEAASLREEVEAQGASLLLLHASNGPSTFTDRLFSPSCAAAHAQLSAALLSAMTNREVHAEVRLRFASSLLDWPGGAQLHLSLSLSNGSHSTLPFSFRPIPLTYSDARNQTALFHREQAQMSSALDAVSGLSRAQRRWLPSEEAAGAGRCPQPFLAEVAEYRQFHALQVTRIRQCWRPKALNSSTAAPSSPLLWLAADAWTSVWELDVECLAALLAEVPGEPPLRLLVARAPPGSGVSDSQNGLIGMFLTAMRHRMVILLDEGNWKGVDLFFLPSVQLYFSRTLPPSLLSDGQLKSRNLLVSFSVGDYHPKLDFPYHYPLLIIESKMGFTLDMLEKSNTDAAWLRGLGSNSLTITGCVYHALWRLRWSVLSLPQYRPSLTALLSPDAVSVGIQIRSLQDAAFAASVGPAPAQDAHSVLFSAGAWPFFHCAHDVSDSAFEAQATRNASRPVSGQALWYLMTDDERVLRAAVQRWGGPQGNAGVRLITADIPDAVGHSRAEHATRRARQMDSTSSRYTRHALVQQLLFSFCQHFIITRQSGFGRVPAALSMRAERVYTLKRFDEGKWDHPCIDAGRDAETLRQSSSEWEPV